MSNPYQQRRRPGKNACVALAISLLSLFVLAFMGPTAHAQANSPGGGQPTDSSPAPAQGGVSNQSGPNVGGDDEAGNRTTPGQGGATGGGAGAPAGDDGGGGGSIVGLVVLAALVLIGAGIFVSSRQRRLERVEAT